MTAEAGEPVGGCCRLLGGEGADRTRIVEAVEHQSCQRHPPRRPPGRRGGRPPGGGPPPRGPPQGNGFPRPPRAGGPPRGTGVPGAGGGGYVGPARPGTPPNIVSSAATNVWTSRRIWAPSPFVMTLVTAPMPAPTTRR